MRPLSVKTRGSATAPGFLGADTVASIRLEKRLVNIFVFASTVRCCLSGSGENGSRQYGRCQPPL